MNSDIDEEVPQLVEIDATTSHTKDASLSPALQELRIDKVPITIVTGTYIVTMPFVREVRETRQTLDVVLLHFWSWQSDPSECGYVGVVFKTRRARVC